MLQLLENINNRSISHSRLIIIRQRSGVRSWELYHTYMHIMQPCAEGCKFVMFARLYLMWAGARFNIHFTRIFKSTVTIIFKAHSKYALLCTNNEYIFHETVILKIGIRYPTAIGQPLYKYTRKEVIMLFFRRRGRWDNMVIRDNIGHGHPLNRFWTR